MKKPTDIVEGVLSSFFIAQLPAGILLAAESLTYAPIWQLVCFPSILGIIAVCGYKAHEEITEIRAYNQNQTRKMKEDKVIKITVLDQNNGVLVLTGTAEPDIYVSRTIDFDPDDHSEGDYVMKAIGSIANMISEIVRADPEKYPSWQSIGNLKLDVTVTDEVEENQPQEA